MSGPVAEKNFEYFQKFIYTSICDQYVALWNGASEETFVRDVVVSMFRDKVSGDALLNHCIQKNSLLRRDLVIVSCGYLLEATYARALGQEHLSWSYLMDAQLYISSAIYASELRNEMPELEAEAAENALWSSRSKGGLEANKVGRLIGDKAIELIKAKGENGHIWPRIRDAVKDIKVDLWPFMEKEDPGRSEDNYERSVVERLKKRKSEISHFFSKIRP